jgi:tetratricopeptide (TPR) repeat protein
MKPIISLFLLLTSLYANAGVVIYKNDTSLMALEQTSKGDVFNSTLFGGSSESGSSSPADCTIKFKLTKNEKGFSGSLQPFSTELMGYSESDEGSASFEIDNIGVTLTSQEPINVCSISTDFTGDYKIVNESSNDYKRDFNDLLQLNYQNAVKTFRAGKGHIAIELLDPYMSDSVKRDYYQSNVFNDYGYFLQQAGMNDEAIKYLKIVQKKSPKRVVAYLNIADAYWSINKKYEAVINYKKYVSMMKASKDDKHIPDRANERSQ